jgi:amino acid permease
MEFAVIFGVYAALIAYMIGMGQSFSQLFFGHGRFAIICGVVVGLLMSLLLKGGIKSLKKFEKYGVGIILVLLGVIFFVFLNKVNIANLFTFNSAHILLPFGVVLFALMSFHSVPEVKIVLKRNEYQFRKVMVTGTIVSIIFYSLFALVVVGFKGIETPAIATLALGSIFIILGIFTMFTSYLASGNALRESFQFDERYSKKMSWFLATIVPIGLFLLTQLTDFFSFTRILSIGGVVSGGIIAILILLMVKKAKKKGNRKPEYSVNANWVVIGLLVLVFLFGVVRELLI